MKHKAEFVWGAAVGLGFAAVAATAITSGCAGSGAPWFAAAEPEMSGESEAGPDGGGALELSGAQLWEQSCARCHNSRDPKDYSDAQWEIAVMHMCAQARLTSEEESKITEFLKASN